MSAEHSAPTRTFRSIRLMGAVALMVALVACGGDDTPTIEEAVEAATADAEQAVESAVTAAGAGSVEELEEQALETAEELAEDLTESLENQQAAQGGGSATLTVGDETWNFDSVLCAFGEEQIGQEGAEFVLSSIQDGLQLYASVDSFGHSVSLNDINDFENPSVSLTADKFSASMAGGSAEFVTLDGTRVEATAPFLDDTSDGMETVEGTLQADCP